LYISSSRMAAFRVGIVAFVSRAWACMLEVASSNPGEGGGHDTCVLFWRGGAWRGKVRARVLFMTLLCRTLARRCPGEGVSSGEGSVAGSVLFWLASFIRRKVLFPMLPSPTHNQFSVRNLVVVYSSSRVTVLRAVTAAFSPRA
jgi:hypothetical protein